MTQSAATSSPPSEIDAIIACIASGDAAGAEHLADQFLQKSPSHAKAWYLRGFAQRAYGNRAGAIASFNQALRWQSDFLEACHDLAATLEEEKQTELAIGAYEHYFKIVQFGGTRPSNTVTDATFRALDVYFKEGSEALEKLEFKKAESTFRKALGIFPNSPGVLLNLGIALYRLGRFEEGIEYLLQCLRFQTRASDTSVALLAIGNCYAALRVNLRSIAAYRRALGENPNHIEAALNLGRLYYRNRDYAKALEAYQKAVAIDGLHPAALTECCHLLHVVCRFDEAEAMRLRMVEALQENPIGPPFIVIGHAPEMAKINAVDWIKRHGGRQVPYEATRPLPAAARSDGKLRIGYLSGDFNYHATTFLMADLFARHDRSKFEIYAYSYSLRDGSEEYATIQRRADHFREVITLNPQQVYDLIRQDGIDILVDLKGHTHDAKVEFFGLRPAPIQMHYLVYPGTIGSPAIDYFIADPYTAPPGVEDEFVESLIRLPRCYQINSSTRPVLSEKPSRAEFGLPEDGLVLCDFNNTYKYTKAMFSLWLRVLQAAPGSVLWLYETHPDATENLKRVAAAQGVDASRLIFAKSLPVKEHLRRYWLVDLVLDTSPVCGHTTTSDALWCGAPVLALKGHSFISRVGESLLRAVDLPQLVVSDMAEYEKMALELVNDPQRLRRLREHLETGRSQFALFDTQATTRAIEAAYLKAAERHRAGRPPQSFSITSEEI